MSTSESLYRAIIEYDGSEMFGFQIQDHGRTVQGEIENTLRHLTQNFVRIVGAGRTDAGVHARGQVIAFRASWKHSLADFHRAINALLPNDISFLSLDIAPEGFHPRFSALRRCYRYQIGLWPVHSPLRARYAWELSSNLDIKAIQTASRYLIGMHDFATFGQPPSGHTTLRHIFSADWRVRHPYLYFDLCANAFLRRMVRNITTALVYIGQGKYPPDFMRTLIVATDRSQSPPPAPPQGLFLKAILYPTDDEIVRMNASRNHP